MPNKRNLLKSSLFVSFIVGFGLSFASAATFKMELKNEGILSPSNLSPIHFADNGNNFGGFFYFSNGENESEDNLGIEVYAGGDRVICKQKMKGFYYNSERGERLWPLDEDTSKSWGMDSQITIAGGLYTRCVKDGYDAFLATCEAAAEGQENAEEILTNCIEDGEGEYLDDNSYYGSIEHTYKGWKYGLVAGLGYTTGTAWVELNDSKLSPTFQRVENRYPVGLIYDYNGGVGLVGCKLNDFNTLNNFVNKLSDDTGVASFFVYTGEDEGWYLEVNDPSLNFDCKDIGSAGNSLIGMIVDGLIGMSSESEAGVIGNQTNSKMQYFSSSNINNATLINYVKQRASVLCRGKWKSRTSSIGSERVVCIDGEGGNVDASQLDEGKTLIVRNGNVIVKPDTSSKEYLYDVFVDNGNLLVDDSSTDGLFVFQNNGFKSDTTPGDFRDAVYDSLFGPSCQTKQNSCPEGEVCNCAYEGEDVAVGKLLRGNFIVNGNVGSVVEGGSISNKYFIYGKFTTKFSADDLMDVFTWECTNGLDGNGAYCPPSSYQNASLVVIDQNYDSPLFW